EAVRDAIGDHLAAAFQGHVSAYYLSVLDAPLSRVHFIIGRDGGSTPDPDPAELEAAVSALVRTWADGLGEALAGAHDPAVARMLLARYRDAFSDGYRDTYAPVEAVADIGVIESLDAAHPLGVALRLRTPASDAGAAA